MCPLCTVGAASASRSRPHAGTKHSSGGTAASSRITSVYGMDHTGDDHHTDGEPGVDVPVESGHRSQALLAGLAEAERARVQARIAVTVPINTLAGLGEQPAISIDRQTASFGRLRRPHASAGADARNRSAPKGRFAAPTRSGR